MKDIIFRIIDWLKKRNKREIIICVIFLSVFLVSLYGKHDAWALTSVLILYALYDEIRELIRRIKKLPYGTELQDPTEEEIKQSKEELNDIIRNKSNESNQKVVHSMSRMEYNLFVNEVIFSNVYKNIKVDREKKLVSDNQQIIFDGKYLDSKTGSICFVEIKIMKTYVTYVYISIRNMLSLINSYSLTVNNDARLDFVLCSNISEHQKKLLEKQFQNYIENGRLRIIYITSKELDEYINNYNTSEY